MIAPTGRTVALVALGAPVALLVGLIWPTGWIVALALAALVVAAFSWDALMAPAPGEAAISLVAPAAVGVGDVTHLDLHVDPVRGAALPPGAAALSVEPRLSETGRLDADLLPFASGLRARFTLVPGRRGPSGIGRAWVRWTGRLGLAHRFHRAAFQQPLAIVPSIRAVREEGARLFARDAQVGQRLNARLGEGSEFESLVRFMPGLDRRAIDWKQSARHMDLLAKQFETERDNRIVLAVDCGRMMSDPMPGADGAAPSRLDRAVSAALTLGYVALKMEDRVSLHSFADKPLVATREFSRIGDFAALRRAAADIDYGEAETNYTLGLVSLGARLKRRALIVLFTEFADASSAEMMLTAAHRLSSQHLLLFVVLADSELEGITARVPQRAEDVAGATVAADLLRDRRLVFARLRRMGALVVEAPVEGLSGRLLQTYVRIKRQGLL